jgi:hypothetical protein
VGFGMDWSRSETISALALLISSLGFVVSFISYRRVSKLEQPLAWVEIESIGVQDCWRASIHLSNPTRQVLKLTKVSTPIKRVPIDARQDFILGDYQEALSECGNDLGKLGAVLGGKDRHLSISLPADHEAIQPGATGVFRFLLFRGRLSTARKAKFSIHYVSMEETAKRSSKKILGEIPGPGLEIQVRRV